MVKAEALLALRVQMFPILAALFQKSVRTHNISLDKFGCTINRAVNVGLSGQVYDDIRLELFKLRAYFCGVGNIGMAKCVTRMPLCLCQRVQIAGVAQCINIQNVMFAGLEQVADKSRADKTGSACHNNTHN